MSRASSAAAVEQTVPCQKGVGFANLKGYAESKHGEGAWQKVLARLEPADREVVTSAIAVGWYETLLFARVLRAADAVLGRGNLGLMREIGAWEAEQDFNRVMRVFLRILTPEQVFKAEARLWRHFQDSGIWTMTPVASGIDGDLRGWAVDEALYLELSGYLARLLEYAGGKDVVVTHSKCRSRGHDVCRFENRWR